MVNDHYSLWSLSLEQLKDSCWRMLESGPIMAKHSDEVGHFKCGFHMFPRVFFSDQTEALSAEGFFQSPSADMLDFNPRRCPPWIAFWTTGLPAKFTLYRGRATVAAVCIKGLISKSCFTAPRSACTWEMAWNWRPSMELSNRYELVVCKVFWSGPTGIVSIFMLRDSKNRNLWKPSTIAKNQTKRWNYHDPNTHRSFKVTQICVFQKKNV